MAYKPTYNWVAPSCSEGNYTNISPTFMVSELLQFTQIPWLRFNLGMAHGVIPTFCWLHAHTLSKGDIIPWPTSSWVLRSTTSWSTPGTKPKWLRPSPKWCARYPYLGMVGGMNMGKQGWLRMDIESVCKSLFLAFKFIETHFFFGFWGSLRILNWVWIVLWHMFRKSSNMTDRRLSRRLLFCARNGFLVVQKDRSQVEIRGSWHCHRVAAFRFAIASAAVFFGPKRATNSTWRPTPWRRVARRF